MNPVSLVKVPAELRDAVNETTPPCAMPGCGQQASHIITPLDSAGSPVGFLWLACVACAYRTKAATRMFPEFGTVHTARLR